jgi:hypothetical protein
MKPAPPLSNTEIAAAKAKGKQQQQQEEEDDGIFDLAGLGGGSGSSGGIKDPGFGLAANASDKQYFAVVDYRPWLANADWEAIKMMYMYYAINKWENSKPGYITEIRDYLEDKGMPGKLPVTTMVTSNCVGRPLILAPGNEATSKVTWWNATKKRGSSFLRPNPSVRLPSKNGPPKAWHSRSATPMPSPAKPTATASDSLKPV